MKTLVTNSTGKASAIIKRGGTVAFPTETVYGLGADCLNEKAVVKIFEAKNRPADNPLIAHIGHLDQIGLLASEISGTAEKFIRKFFPAPLTLVLPKAKEVPLIATAGLDTIGVRMPKSDLTLEFLKKCETPVVAPSANLSGRPSPTTWQAVFEDLDGRIECILKGEISEIGLESTVLDCTSEIPLVLRTGAITLEELQKIVPETELYKIAEGEQPKSPGLKHRHYSPSARVILVQSLEFRVQSLKTSAFIGLVKPLKDFKVAKVCNSVEDYAHSVFDFFRRCDREGIKTIYCETVEEKGIGLALMDRLKRAADA